MAYSDDEARRFVSILRGTHYRDRDNDTGSDEAWAVPGADLRPWEVTRTIQIVKMIRARRDTYPGTLSSAQEQAYERRIVKFEALYAELIA